MKRYQIFIITDPTADRMLNAALQIGTYLVALEVAGERHKLAVWAGMASDEESAIQAFKESERAKAA